MEEQINEYEASVVLSGKATRVLRRNASLQKLDNMLFDHTYYPFEEDYKDLSEYSLYSLH